MKTIPSARRMNPVRQPANSIPTMNPTSTTSIDIPERKSREQYAFRALRPGKALAIAAVLIALGWNGLAGISVEGQSASPLPSPGPDPVAIATEFVADISMGISAAAQALETPE